MTNRLYGRAGYRLFTALTSVGCGVAGWVVADRLTYRLAGHGHAQDGAVVQHAHGFVLPVAIAAVCLALASLLTVMRLRVEREGPGGHLRRGAGRRSLMVATALPAAGFLLEEITRYASGDRADLPPALLLAIGVTLQSTFGALSWLLCRVCGVGLRRLFTGPRLSEALVPGAPRVLAVARVTLLRSTTLRRRSGRAPPTPAVV